MKKKILVVNILISIILSLFLLKNAYAHDFKTGYVERIIDGDTIDVKLDLGFDITIKRRLRLVGVDAPEIRTLMQEEKLRGFYVKNALENYLLDAAYLKIQLEGRGKYGRDLAVVYKGDDKVSINELVAKWTKEARALSAK